MSRMSVPPDKVQTSICLRDGWRCFHCSGIRAFSVSNKRQQNIAKLFQTQLYIAKPKLYKRVIETYFIIRDNFSYSYRIIAVASVFCMFNSLLCHNVQETFLQRTNQ